MTYDQQVGGLFMAGVPGPELDASTRSLIRDHRIGNFIIFKRNVIDPGQLRRLCQDLREACRDQGLPDPLIAVDQEGGSVTRLPPPFTQFPDARQLTATRGPETELARYATTCAAELRGVGINMNLAPVLDVCPEGQGFFMERRSLSGDARQASRWGRLLITTMQQEGVAACGKHFPGLGAAVLDPHERLPRVERALAAIRRQDLPPFQEAASAGVAAIMTSHTLYSTLDPEWPATLSERILTGLLRQEIGYSGVIVTDDLEMGAIEREGPIEEAALQAFLAGADLLLICHDHLKVRKAHQRMTRALAAGQLTPARVAGSRERLAAVQDRYGVL